MRKTIASLALALSMGSALAQTTASHAVTVYVPNVLRLKIGDGAGSSQAQTSININVTDDVVLIEPSGTEVQVLANSSWQLSARYNPARPRDAGARLQWQLENGGWQPFADFDQPVSSGPPTGGWRSLRLTYGLDTPVPRDGTYQGVITYTLTRP